jgi:hypothetical protein
VVSHIKGRLQAFENRVLREIFGLKRDKAIRKWRKLHNEELHNVYSSPNIIRQIKVTENGVGGTHGREEKSLQAFGWKS